tara:strand:+ start:374 stop:598 length:225 start_codon:yes stop_codon:yes gene_type:complete
MFYHPCDIDCIMALDNIRDTVHHCIILAPECSGTPCDYNPGIWVSTVHTTDESASLSVSLIRDRACIDNDDLCF